MCAEYVDCFIFAAIGALAGVIVTLIVNFPNKIIKKQAKEKKEEEERLKYFEGRLDVVEDGMRSLLRSEIQKVYLNIMRRGYALPYEKDNVNYLYKAYIKAGGNSFISKLYDQIMEMPIAEGEEYEL